MMKRIAVLLFFACLAHFCLLITVVHAHAEEPHSLGVIGIADRDGIRVAKIISGGPAETAGLALGDVLITIDGTPAKRITEKSELMTSKKAGSRVVVTYLRQGQKATSTLVVGIATQTTIAAAAGVGPNRQAEQAPASLEKVSAEFAKATPVVRTFNVDSSTTHKIAADKAA